MKFGKWLQQQIRESLPAWRDKFILYKELKKLVNLVSSPPSDPAVVAEVDAELRRLLDSEIDKFNDFFQDREEYYVICQQELRERIRTLNEAAGGTWSDPFYREEMQWIRRDVVDLQGEMVLLVNYSCVNYAGVAKILKKYEKRTGRLLRLPFIQKVLQQPFFTIDIISNLVQECENMNMVFPIVGEEGIEAAREGTVPSEVEEQSIILRNIVAAVVIMGEMRRASSTYSPHSLPPLNLPDNEIDISSSLFSEGQGTTIDMNELGLL